MVTRRDLLTHVWRMPYGGADKTVDVHVSWLRRKLGETAQQPRYLHTVRGVGIKLSPPPMRLRVILLVVATSSLVLVSFLVPLALVLRTLAADRAMSAATAEAQSLAPLVATLPASSLRLTVDQVNAENQYPGHGLPAVGRRARPARARHARGAPGQQRPELHQPRLPAGEQVLVAVEGLRGRLRA